MQSVRAVRNFVSVQSAEKSTALSVKGHHALTADAEHTVTLDKEV